MSEEDASPSPDSMPMLDPAARFRRLEEIFHRASELPEGKRAEFLRVACSDDAELLLEVERMLGVESSAEERLGSAVASELESFNQRNVPEKVGVYRILELLGEGGLGAVYLAERADEHFHKRVAIKWLRPEMGSAELERRFLLERQVLAALEHPYIARILDGGTHQGAAYIVMELVEGQNLLDYCRSQSLSVEGRLRLFRKVCEAVHYAHQSLILHCDLKPSNILVDEGGSPKLVDFGIAKALRGSLPTSSDEVTATRTLTGIRPLTPEYASPEQARYRSLTTSSDVYSLGIVLYELLSGKRPYRISTSNPLEIAEQIAKNRVPRPSSRYVEQQDARRSRSAPWSSDLDAIVAKAIRKEPEERYNSVADFSQDILRYLENRPVTARRGNWFYQVTKLVRRHRLGAAALTTVVLSLSVSTAMTARQARVADWERMRAEESLSVAEEEKERAEAVVELLVGLFEVSHPEQALGTELTAREVLDRGSRRVREQLEDRPELREALAAALGRVYRELDILDQAELHLKDSLEIRTSTLEGSAPEIVEAIYQMALLRLDQNQLESAHVLLSRALEIEGEARGSHSLLYGEIQRAQALCLLEQGKIDSARRTLESYLSDSSRSGAAGSLERAEGEDLLSRVAYEEGNPAEAEQLALSSLSARRDLLGDEHPKVARSLNNLVAIRGSQGDREGQLSVLEQILEIRRKVYGDYHGAVAQSLQNLGVVLSQDQEFELAESRLDEAESILRQIYDADHTSLADVIFSKARVAERRGRFRDAASLHRRALEIRRLKLSPDHPSIAYSLVGLANSLSKEDPEAAEPHYLEALALQRAKPDLYGPNIAPTLEKLGALRCRQDLDAGAKLLREALQIRRSRTGGEAWVVALGEARLGRCLARIDAEQGLEQLRDAVGLLAAELGEDHGVTRRARGWLEEVVEELD